MTAVRPILNRFSLVVIALMLFSGCGTTQQRTGTEQLLLSDSVDRAVDQMDVSALARRRVYLDTTYINAVKGVLFVNSDYIISALRHKLITSGCLIQADKNSADYILEARVGALGTDSLEVTYGIPASNVLNQASTVLGGVPAMPTIPEVSVGKRNATMSTSKIVLYAYHRETGTPVWQSGSAVAKSDAKDTWLMGAGPMQRGSIYKGTRFAGARIKIPFVSGKRKPDPEKPITVADSHQFVHPAVLEQQLAEAEAAKNDAIQAASHEEEKKE
jgi:hypothetical protein